MGDWTEIVPGLWQGREPATAGEVAHFDLVTLSWEDGQKDWGRFDVPNPDARWRTRFIRAPMEDDTRRMRPGDDVVAFRCAERVVDALRAGESVLVTCMQGMNRSGLIVALALRARNRWESGRCIERIRSKRPGALYNPAFVDFLMALP